jgi:hypothetical protein
MTLASPEPNEQHLLSVRYVAQSVCCIPTTDPDQWGVFIGGAASRKLVGIISSEEMVAYLRKHWADNIAQHTARTLERNTPAVKVSTAELDDILADLTL